jgi:immune inhibitor A
VGTGFVGGLTTPAQAGAVAGSDDIPHPLGTAQRANRAEALGAVMSGKDTSKGTVKRVANGQYVELEREAEDPIFTILVDFGDTPSPYFGGLAGPQHNEIPEPDRDVDNYTYWLPDFDREHYEDMLFAEGTGEPSMRDMYLEMSSNRYTVYGDVSDWVSVPYNTAHYGSNYCGAPICAPTIWWLVQDGADAWYDSMIDEGMTAAEIDAYLATFDVWDRYDHDGDGDFDEPDGYIDHFQLVHAGIGEEMYLGSEDTGLVWSHRWYAFYDAQGSSGPPGHALLGGVQIGASSYWIGDYTMEAENSTVGVFAHEFGHDLGLPDLYDRFNGDAVPGFWSLMAVGSNSGEPLGSHPVHLGAWEKLQLGWLDYELAEAATKSEHKLGPSTTTTKQAQALVVTLPDKDQYADLGEAYAGDAFFYSGQGDNLFNTMGKAYDLGADSTLTAWVRYDIELDYDYAYLGVSLDGGETISVIPTNLSSGTNPYGQNIDLAGITGTTGGDWVELEADLSAYEGEVLLGFGYATDYALVRPGFMVDEIAVTGHDTEGAETDTGWAFAGFSITEGEYYVGTFFHAYIAEFRQYTGYDAALETGPYAGVWTDYEAGELWLAHFPYQDGLLVSYWDTAQHDNDTSQHPGVGLILPVDAHPDGMPGYSAMFQTYDATFGLDATDPFDITIGETTYAYVASQKAEPVFDDTVQHWRAHSPTSGVMHPDTNTRIRVKSVSAHGTFMQVEINAATKK